MPVRYNKGCKLILVNKNKFISFKYKHWNPEDNERCKEHIIIVYVVHYIPAVTG